MRPQRVRGMRPTDRHILEFLDNRPSDPIVASPVVIAANIDYVVGSVRERVTPLRKCGLLEYVDRKSGIYGITDLGQRYLRGGLDDHEVSQLEECLSQYS